MFYSPPLCGISANTEFTIFQPQTQKAAIFKSSKECARYYHLLCNTKNQKEAETKGNHTDQVTKVQKVFPRMLNVNL